MRSLTQPHTAYLIVPLRYPSYPYLVALVPLDIYTRSYPFLSLV